LEAGSLNQLLDSGRIGSETTANDYIENTIAFGLGRRAGNMFQLGSLGKALVCVESTTKASLTTEEKAILLACYLRHDLDALVRLLSFLRDISPVSITDIAEKYWSNIFHETPLIHLRKASRLHRTIPRLEWYADLGIVEKIDNKYTPSERVETLLRSNEEMAPVDMSFGYYFPGNLSELATTNVEEFEKVVENMYQTLLVNFLRTFEVEIDALRCLTITKMLNQRLMLTSGEFDRMLLGYWRRNLDRVRLSSSSVAEGHTEEGITYGSRLYCYIAIQSCT